MTRNHSHRNASEMIYAYDFWDCLNLPEEAGLIVACFYDKEAEEYKNTIRRAAALECLKELQPRVALDKCVERGERSGALDKFEKIINNYHGEFFLKSLEVDMRIRMMPNQGQVRGIKRSEALDNITDLVEPFLSASKTPRSDFLSSAFLCSIYVS